MKILQIIDDLRIGGAQKLQLGFAPAAHERGHDVTVATLREIPGSPIPAQLESLGTPVVLIEGTRLIDLRRLPRLIRLLRRERFDVVHTHLLESNILGAIAGRLAATPVVGSLHNTEPFTGRHAGIKQRIEYLALRRCTSCVVAVGHIVAESHAEHLQGARLEVVPNAVPLIPPLPADERNALRSELAGRPDRLIVLTLGRLHRQKGYDVLLRAFAELRPSHPSAALLIAGSGSEREGLERLIASLDLGDRARLLGPRADPERLLAAADIFVSSSRWEGLPLAVLEAMAAGLPIVATGVGDVPRVLTESTGRLVPPEEPGALAGEIARLLDDAGLRRELGDRARDRIEREYAVGAWCDRLLAAYADAAARQASA